MKTKPVTALLGLLLAAGLAAGCAQVTEAQKGRQQAKTTGKYKVRLTEDSESVVGTCKFVTAINADFNFKGPQTQAGLYDYFREEAVYASADTVLVRGRVGEAYICGPGPLNPDGTLRILPQPTQ
ncbi:MAG: hypothetical protein WEB59_00365 [Thermoanaerobaculia bacterium]